MAHISSGYIPNNAMDNYWRRISKSVIVFGILSAISLSVYLVASHYTYGIGFPLDDAWIHQTYARNLIQYRDWVYMPDQPSAGSTAPLWTAFLSVGYLIGWSPYLWTYLLGWLALLLTGLFGAYAFWLVTNATYKWVVFVGCVLILEWHITWSAASGMETLAFACIVLFTFCWLLAGWGWWWAYGMIIGFSVWLRPDGITLLGPALFVIILGMESWRNKLISLIQLFTGFLLLFFPYLLFNQYLAGSWWPNTFFAKQTEYAILTRRPLVERFLQQSWLPLIGAGILFLPGYVTFSIDALINRKIASIASVLWYLGYLTLYALRLPVTYQHGRYIMPAMPVYFVFGVAGSWYLINSIRSDSFRRVVIRTWILATIAVIGAFWLIGGRTYANEVALIETEMVNVARWIGDYTDPESLVAAHDIGALGYFTNRRILDLAGLVSPEVIPIIRDETALGEYLNKMDADYLVTFPGWYPELIRHAKPIYQTQGVFSPVLGGENMVVYQWLH